MLNTYDITQLECWRLDILLQNEELSECPSETAAEIIMMNAQQLEIIEELRQAALN